MARIFWILFGIEAAGFLFLLVQATRGPRHWGPEGPVGAWIIFVVPPLMLGVPLAVFLLAKSDSARIVASVLVALPLLQTALGPVFSAFQNFQSTRRVEGDAIFKKPVEREIAHACRAHDAETVKRLIGQAGDVNAGHGREDSLFRFCMTNLDKSQGSFEIVKAMLAAGANPKVEMAGGTFPLYWAIQWGPEMTKLLLDAGADPNIRDSGRPLWWEAMESGYMDEKLPSLTMFLDRGADLTLRDDGENGPVGFAAQRKNWPAAWLLIERGAAWKDERGFGTPVAQLAAFELQNGYPPGKAPAELVKVAALYGIGADGH